MFNVGDIITGKHLYKEDDFPYTVTTSEAKMVVVRIIDDGYAALPPPSGLEEDDIVVRVLDHSTRPTCVGNEYEVNSEYFELWGSELYHHDNVELDEMLDYYL